MATEIFVKVNSSQGSAWERFGFWKLTLMKLGVKSFVALFVSVAATLNGVEWSQFTNTQKVLAVGAAIVAVCNVVDAFLNDTMSKMSAIADVERKSELAKSGDDRLVKPAP